MAEYLTVADVARRPRLHEVTIGRHISDGRLPTVALAGAFASRREDLERFLEPMEEDPDAAELLASRSAEELERRRQVVRRILENRERRVISPLTTAQLVREARAPLATRGPGPRREKRGR
jgi:uncharacterized protein (DUF2336 family)